MSDNPKNILRIRKSRDSGRVRQTFNRNLTYPGLTSNAREIQALIEDIHRRFSVYRYKRELRHIWVAFLGGTGTGKSTLFNAVCGSPLSKTGVERPKTSGPIAYAHHSAHIEKDFPFADFNVHRQPVKNQISEQEGGAPGRLLILEHDREALSHLILIDSPDLDSIEPANRIITEDLFLLSDIVMFVTSQEKYSDKVPSRFFERVLEEEKPYFFLFNKMEEKLSIKELGNIYLNRGIRLNEDRAFFIHTVPPPVSQRISEQPNFLAFFKIFSSKLAPQGIHTLKQKQQAEDAKKLNRRVHRLFDLLKEEDRAFQKWLCRLDKLYQRTSRDLIEDEKERYMAKSRPYLKSEVRNLFTRYDVLAKPRLFLKEIVLIPFRLFGPDKAVFQKVHRQSFRQLTRKMDLTPVFKAVDRFNREVIENLSPQDEKSPLRRKLRTEGLMLNEKEARERIEQEQERLAQWLEETFRELSKGIPKSKKWGIYSTSILWGILILSLEISIGGGFSILDAALDSTLAPLVTKGAAELFAYHEIQKITQALATRYQDGLLSPLKWQRNRYEKCIRDLETKKETFEILMALQADIEKPGATNGSNAIERDDPKGIDHAHEHE